MSPGKEGHVCQGEAPLLEENHFPAVIKQRLIIERWRMRNTKLERTGRKDELLRRQL